MPAPDLTANNANNHERKGVHALEIGLCGCSCVRAYGFCRDLGRGRHRRHDEAIAHAEKLAGEGKVVRNEDFSRKDVQKSLLQRELEAPSSPIERVNGKSPFHSESDIVKKAARQTRSLFFRDLFEPLEKKGWFS